MNEDQFALRGLDRINVLLGKNGCGKSTMLKEAESHASAAESPDWGATRYITPERGGVLTFEGSVEQATTQNPRWLAETRRGNQFNQFREQTVVQYRKLELSVLRQFEDQTLQGGDQAVQSFQAILDSINSLLDNIEIRREGAAFALYDRATGAVVDAKTISSGESELISLAIEALAFAQEIEDGVKNLLCLDEPDVHLHPDLQSRLLQFLIELVDRYDLMLLIATHSTAILGGLTRYDHATVGLMKMRDRQIAFRAIDDVMRQVLPVFGAHPLSNVFNEAPVLLVEGEDDVRIWQQAVRSSAGSIKLYPIDCGSVDAMHDYETEVKQILDAVYDDARAFSLRDRDGVEGEIDDIPPVVRMRLGCRTAENLLLANEVLASVELSWDDVEARVEDWLSKNPDHAKHDAMKSLKDGGYDRKRADLKDLRMLLVGEIFASNKPWEILVGAALSEVRIDGDTDFGAEGAFVNFLGEKASRALLPTP